MEADDVTLVGLHLLGPQAEALVPTEVGIIAAGTRDDPIERLTVSESTVERFGDSAISLGFAADVTITGNTFRDVARAGLEVRAGDEGVIAGNLVARVGVPDPDAETSASPDPTDDEDQPARYGIILAPAEPERGTAGQEDRDLDVPPTTAFVVVGNVVTDVPAGGAFATEGGQRILWAGNTALRVRSPFVVTGSAEHRAADNDLDGNTAYGWSGADWAFSSTYSTRGFVRNNTIASWPEGREIRTAVAADPAAPAADLVVTDNAITADPAPRDDPEPFVPETMPEPPPPPVTGPEPTPTPGPGTSPEPSPTPTPSPEPAGATLEITTSAPAGGRHRVDPGSTLDVALAAVVDRPSSGSWLVLDLPPGWTVLEAGTGVADRGSTTVTWPLGDLPAGAETSVQARLRAPTTRAQGERALDASLGARLGDVDGPSASASTAILVAPPIVVEHSVLAEVAPGASRVRYNEPGVSLGGLVRFDRIRVRFQVRNADLDDVKIRPTLQVGVDGAPFVDVTADADGDPVVRLAAEWRPDPDGTGTLPGPDVESIKAGELRVPDVDNATQRPVVGRRVMGEGSAGMVVLPGDAYTEIEFSLKISRTIEPRTRLQFRLADNGEPLDGAAIATAIAAEQVELPLSPGQLEGIPVGQPLDVKPAALGDVDYPLVLAASAAAWPEANAEPRYQLAVAVPAQPEQRYQLNAPFTSPHMPDYSLVSDTCAACHRAHASENTNLLAEPAPQATMCFTCHDGSGSELDVEARYTDPSVPANDPGTTGTERSAYFRHDAVTPPSAPYTHSLTSDDEFGGVLNRHSECADCHNSHNATTTASTQLSDGWTVSGRQASVSGVAVAHAATAGDPPTYTFLAGTGGSQPTREYQVCLKCHSGFTTLPAADPAFPSSWAVDKGIEINPANGSYHPIAAAGTSDTAQMRWSLANGSPFKQWNFTTESTVRCVHCHGDPSKFNATTPPDPGSDLAPHVSSNRGILFQPYRDRELKGADEFYDAADSALCFVCHAEQPFRSGNQTVTRFNDHDVHLSTIEGMGPGGTDIDTPGAGEGLAICAECHFRSHSTAQAYNETDRANSGLVNFAPNVEALDGVLKYTRTAAGGTCTLVCHGAEHDAESYP